MHLLTLMQAMVLVAAADGTPVVAKKVFGRHFAHPLDAGLRFIDRQAFLLFAAIGGEIEKREFDAGDTHALQGRRAANAIAFFFTTTAGKAGMGVGATRAVS
jgi:hypothetical protein